MKKRLNSKMDITTMYYNLKAHSENLKYNLNNGLTKSNIHNVLYLANEIKSISETIIENKEYTEKRH